MSEAKCGSGGAMRSVPDIASPIRAPAAPIVYSAAIMLIGRTSHSANEVATRSVDGVL